VVQTQQQQQHQCLDQSTTRHGGLSFPSASSLTARSVSGGHRSSRISAAQLTTKRSISQPATGMTSGKNNLFPTITTTSRRIRQRRCSNTKELTGTYARNAGATSHLVHSKGNGICTINIMEGQRGTGCFMALITATATNVT
jgi:hypothetical protein